VNSGKCAVAHDFAREGKSAVHRRTIRPSSGSPFSPQTYKPGDKISYSADNANVVSRGWVVRYLGELLPMPVLYRCSATLNRNQSRTEPQWNLSVYCLFFSSYFFARIASLENDDFITDSPCLRYVRSIIKLCTRGRRKKRNEQRRRHLLGEVCTILRTIHWVHGGYKMCTCRIFSSTHCPFPFIFFCNSHFFRAHLSNVLPDNYPTPFFWLPTFAPLYGTSKVMDKRTNNRALLEPLGGSTVITRFHQISKTFWEDGTVPFASRLHLCTRDRRDVGW